jgi:Gpi18-like mannosyltransferase
LTDNSEEAKKVWAFMPLYPTITKVVSFYSNDQSLIFTTGIALSNVLFLLSCLLIMSLLKLFKKEKNILKIILLLCFFPGSIYFSFFYTESLFLFLSLVAAIFIKKRNWLAATLIIGLLGITRKTGLLFIVPFIIEYFRYNNIKNFLEGIKLLGLIILQLLPFGIYMLCLGNISQNINSVYSIQSLWSDIPIVPFSGIYHMLVDFRFTTVFQVGLCFVAGYFLWKGKKIMPKEYLIYCGLSIIAFLSTGQVASIIRYLSILFPIYFVIADLIKNRVVFEILLVIFALMQAFLLIMFVSGYSFAT